MSIHRTHHNKDNPYVLINKGFLEDCRLSAKAKGILAYLLSRPDGWETRTDQIISVMRDGRDSVLSGLTELEEHGYFIRFAVTDPDTKKIIHWVKEVFESPELAANYIDDNNLADTISNQPRNRKKLKPQELDDDEIENKPINGKAVIGKAVKGKAVEGKPGYILNKEKSINEKINNEQVSNEEEEDFPTPQIEVFNFEIIGDAPDTPQPKSALEQNQIELDTPPVVTQTSVLARIDSASEQISPKLRSPQLSPEEYETLKLAQSYAWNPATAPWRANATGFLFEVSRAVYEANPDWYSTESGTVNLKKIEDRLSKLETAIRGEAIKALKAYKELMNYVQMSKMSAAGINGKEILKQSAEQIESERIRKASKRKFEL